MHRAMDKVIDLLVITNGGKLGSLKDKVDLAFVDSCMQGEVVFQNSLCKRQQVVHSMIFPTRSVFHLSFVILAGKAFSFQVILLPGAAFL